MLTTVLTPFNYGDNHIMGRGEGEHRVSVSKGFLVLASAAVFVETTPTCAYKAVIFYCAYVKLISFFSIRK